MTQSSDKQSSRVTAVTEWAPQELTMDTQAQDLNIH